MNDFATLLQTVVRDGKTKTKQVLASVQAAWPRLAPRERDRIVLAAVIGPDNWNVSPIVPLLDGLLKLGADPNACLASDRDAYPMRARTSALEICLSELEHPAHVDLVLSKKEVARRNEALTSAARALIAAGADVGPYKRKGSPLDDAAEAGASDLVRLLLSKGADANEKDARGETALFAAARADDGATLRVLLAGGAKDVKNRTNDAAADVAFARGAFDAYDVLSQAFRAGTGALASRFSEDTLTLAEAKRLLTRHRAASFTSIAVSGKEDHAARGAREPAKVERLVRIVEEDLGLPLHRAVEGAKTRLSSSDAERVTLEELDLDLPVTRAGFDAWLGVRAVAS